MDLLNILLLVFLVAVFIALVYWFFNPAGLAKLFSGGARRLLFTVQAPFFADIKAGKKTVDVRVGPDEVYKKAIGSTIKVSVPGGEKLLAVIKGARHYGTLDELIKKEGIKKVAPSAKTDKEAIDMHLAIKNKEGEQVYGEKRIKEKGGVTAVDIAIK
jgi:ASC-1-like (ASCH) protein